MPNDKIPKKFTPEQQYAIGSVAAILAFILVMVIFRHGQPQAIWLGMQVTKSPLALLLATLAATGSFFSAFWYTTLSSREELIILEKEKLEAKTSALYDLADKIEQLHDDNKHHKDYDARLLRRLSQSVANLRLTIKIILRPKNHRFVSVLIDYLQSIVKSYGEEGGYIDILNGPITLKRASRLQELADKIIEALPGLDALADAATFETNFLALAAAHGLTAKQHAAGHE